MEFSEYMGKMGRLYFEGVTSDFSAALLQRLGGSLALAARDAHAVRVEEDALLGFIDLRRSPQQQWQQGMRRWQPHREGILALIRQGRSPNQAVYDYMRRFGTYPHPPRKLQEMLQPVMLSDGSQTSAWMVPTIEFRRRLARGASVMTDTFGALTTMTALAITARDWTHATPAEWDRALNAGEVGKLVGEMAGAHHDAREQWASTHREASQPTR